MAQENVRENLFLNEGETENKFTLRHSPEQTARRNQAKLYALVERAPAINIPDKLIENGYFTELNKAILVLQNAIINDFLAMTTEKEREFEDKIEPFEEKLEKIFKHLSSFDGDNNTCLSNLRGERTVTDEDKQVLYPLIKELEAEIATLPWWFVAISLTLQMIITVLSAIVFGVVGLLAGSMVGGTFGITLGGCMGGLPMVPGAILGSGAGGLAGLGAGVGVGAFIGYNAAKHFTDNVANKFFQDHGVREAQIRVVKAAKEGVSKASHEKGWVESVTSKIFASRFRK